MSFFRFHLSTLGFTFVAAVVIRDLTFDYQNNKLISHSYYSTVSKAPMPYPLILPTIILLIFIHLIVNIVLKKKFLDILTGLLNLPNLYIFVAKLIPNQEEMVMFNYDDPKISDNYEVNKYWHIILLPLIALSAMCQLVARHSESGFNDDESATNNKSNKMKQH